VAERYPVISPDNKSVAYVSDESGEYALHIRSLENDSVKKIRIEQKPSFYWELSWSPDSTKLTFPDRRLGLWLVDVTTETALHIDTSFLFGSGLVDAKLLARFTFPRVYKTTEKPRRRSRHL
jgi:tricorn protease